MKLPQKPSDGELEILRVLWERGPSTVREVHDVLSLHKEAGYTTTLKLMQIMQAKGFVNRTEEGKSHVYTALFSQAHAQRDLLDKLVDSVFGGSSAGLVMQALGSRTPSTEELDEIRRFLDEIAPDSPSSPSKE